MLKRSIKRILLATALISVTSGAIAAQCSVTGHIVDVTPWSDGVVYLNTDASNNCGCAIPSRLGYWYDRDPKAKVWLAMAIAAVTSHLTVTIYGDTTNCANIGNTATVTAITLRP